MELRNVNGGEWVPRIAGFCKAEKIVRRTSAYLEPSPPPLEVGSTASTLFSFHF